MTQGWLPVEVVIDGEPWAKARPRFNRKNGSVFTPAETRSKERNVGLQMFAALKLKQADMSSAFGVSADFYVSSWQRKDVDNMLKLVCDGLNKVVWADDSQVVEIRARKLLDTANPRTVIQVWVVEGADQRPVRDCGVCGRSFRLYPSNMRRRYCSQVCAGIGARTGKEMRCAGCGMTVYRQKKLGYTRAFCSRTCRASVGARELACLQCGKMFSRAKSLFRGREQGLCSVQCLADFRRGKPKGIRVPA